MIKRQKRSKETLKDHTLHFHFSNRTASYKHCKKQNTQMIKKQKRSKETLKDHALRFHFSKSSEKILCRHWSDKS